MMNIHYLQHVPFENMGMMETWALKKDHNINAVRLYLDDPLPKPESPDFLIIMGGPMNIYEEKKYPWLIREKEFIKNVISLNTPVLGICLGAQLIADVLGAKVYPSGIREIGWFPIHKTAGADGFSLFDGIPRDFTAYHWHGDTFDIPDGATHIFKNEACANQGFIYGDRVVGLQFHMEITKSGMLKLIENCKDELMDAPTVQSPEDMLSKDERLTNMHGVMTGFLDALSGIGK